MDFRRGNTWHQHRPQSCCHIQHRGTFDVTLTATNGSGSGSLTRSDYITVIQGTGYCASRSSSNANEYISRVNIGGSSNPSGASFYSDFTGTCYYPLTPGAITNITITPTFPKKSRPEYYRVWIDYNHDGDFLDTGEEVFAANNIKVAATGSFTVMTGYSGSNQDAGQHEERRDPRSLRNIHRRRS